LEETPNVQNIRAVEQAQQKLDKSKHRCRKACLIHIEGMQTSNSRRPRPPAARPRLLGTKKRPAGSGAENEKAEVF